MSVAFFSPRSPRYGKFATVIDRRYKYIMFGVTTSDDYRPVAWMGRYPIDVTTLLVATHVTCMVFACFLIALGGGGILNLLQFDSAQVLHGAFWQLVTYAFVHPPSGLIWFAIEMYMLFVFGREVERFIGRRAYIGLYVLLLLLPSIFLTIWGLGQRVGLRRFRCRAFRNFCRLCHDLSERRNVSADHGKMGGVDFGRSLHAATTRLPCLVGDGGSVVEHGRGVLIHSAAWRRPGIGVVG